MTCHLFRIICKVYCACPYRRISVFVSWGVPFLVVIGTAQSSAPVQLDVKLVLVVASPIDVDAVVVVSIPCNKALGLRVFVASRYYS